VLRAKYTQGVRQVVLNGCPRKEWPTLSQQIGGLTFSFSLSTSRRENQELQHSTRFLAALFLIPVSNLCLASRSWHRLVVHRNSTELHVADEKPARTLQAITVRTSRWPALQHRTRTHLPPYHRLDQAIRRAMNVKDAKVVAIENCPNAVPAQEINATVYTRGTARRR
jgi:hypothetical protein